MSSYRQNRQSYRRRIVEKNIFNAKIAFHFDRTASHVNCAYLSFFQRKHIIEYSDLLDTPSTSSKKRKADPEEPIQPSISKFARKALFTTPLSKEEVS